MNVTQGQGLFRLALDGSHLRLRLLNAITLRAISLDDVTSVNVGEWSDLFPPDTGFLTALLRNRRWPLRVQPEQRGVCSKCLIELIDGRRVLVRMQPSFLYKLRVALSRKRRNPSSGTPMA